MKSNIQKWKGCRKYCGVKCAKVRPAVLVIKWILRPDLKRKLNEAGNAKVV